MFRLSARTGFGGVALVLSCCAPLVAETIRVTPGELAEVLARVVPGDVVQLAPGRYEGAFRAPEGVTIEGDSPDSVTMTGAEFAILQVAGPRVHIRQIHFEGQEGVDRAIASDVPVRIEQCRFSKLATGVALHGAPLSDVIHCDFVECGIGVRAIAGASPTIWGCVFQGGRVGIFTMHGAPYIRNNLFKGVGTGLLAMSKEIHTVSVRHNMFADCETGIEVKNSDSPFLSARNNLFWRCKAAAKGASPEALVGITHSATDQCESAFLVAEGAITAEEHSFLDGAFGVVISDDNRVDVGEVGQLATKGMREATQPEGATALIGLTPNCERPGCNPIEEAEAPPVRFEEDALIANAVGEEYQYVRMIGGRLTSQSLMSKDGKQFDILRVSVPGGPAELRFDVTRFFSDNPWLTP